ncbi:MAG: hypothetical protein L6Q78_11605 [Bacteroidia bacterium]|nr:hypothetical protein [Bacteroidia bacterium]
MKKIKFLHLYSLVLSGMLGYFAYLGYVGKKFYNPDEITEKSKPGTRTYRGRTGSHFYHK